MLAGRLRGRVSFTASRNTPFQALAGDGAKLALWSLLRSGYRIVAFIHDEVVIELPMGADHAAEAERINRIMCEEMQRVIDPVPDGKSNITGIVKDYRQIAATFGVGEKTITEWRRHGAPIQPPSDNEFAAIAR